MAKSNVQRRFVHLPTYDKAAMTEGLSSYPSTELTTLSNGVRVVSQPRRSGLATVGVWIDAGSRYETKENNGVAHFAEHMFFKGTPSRSRVQLEKEVENMGAQLNAYTSREQTVFYMQCVDQEVPHSLEILSDMLQNSERSLQNIENERGTILREMEEVSGQMNEVVLDDLHETAYYGTALGQTILGPAENINKISQADIDNYLKTHYTANRMVIAGSGDFEHSELVKEAEKLFGAVARDPVNGVQPYMQPASFTGSDMITRIDDMDMVHCAVAFPVAGAADPDSVPLMVLQNMLGSWDKASSAGTGKYSASPLIAHLADTDTAESILTFNTQYSDTGLFGFHGVVHPTGLQTMLFEMMESIRSHSYEVDDILLNQAKNQLIMQVLGTLQSSASVTEEMGRQHLMFGRHLHPLETIARIEAVDSNAIRNTATRYFQDRDFAAVAIGPTIEYPDYGALRHSTFAAY